jgi:Z1 domain
MNNNQIKDAKNFGSSLISALALMEGTPTREKIEQMARGLAAVIDYKGDLSPIIEEAMIAVVTRMGEGVSLVDSSAEHDEKWVLKRGDIVHTYADAYEKFLRSEGWHPNVVQSLSDVSAKILGHLQDPTSEGAWNRRGLVIGHVQSGKTANYMGLMAKAADAGYKFIIVIAGIHNNLRKQTQERIDEALIGRSSDPENRIVIGVGLSGGYPHPATLTTIHDDFNQNTAAKSGWKLNDFSKPIILVIKKNVSTLTALHKWLKELNAQGDGRISDVPMLLIDDEADNASINTNKPDLDPTRTNAMIRKILGLFAKSCYVGYTATPFANIFINPEAYDEEVRDELFPRDFIYSLDAPTTYFGPDKVFLNDESSQLILQTISDCEGFLPFSHKREDTVAGLPPSLYRALNQFIIARAIRNLRGQANKHCSMMVNVSRFVPVQRTVRDFISVYEKKLREAVKANYAMPEAVSAKNLYMQNLKSVLEGDYPEVEFDWSEIKASLWSVFDNLRIYVINSKSDEALDFKRYERDGQSLTAIAIGGLSLSRGLTIEGLCVSYMYRNTKMYDTLMQMGRWFGYRPGYEDLCRVHLSPDSINWYSYIARASEELRQQIRRMRRDGLSPKQFGLYVLAHPDQLLITAANKMRSGEKKKVNQNYSGLLIESYMLPTDKETNSANETLIASYWRTGFGKTLKETGKGLIAEDVPVEIIEEFLLKFRVHSVAEGRRTAVVDYLRALSEKHRFGDVLLISLKANGEDRSNFKLGLQDRDSAELDKKYPNAWHLSRERLASRGDERLGLTVAQQEEAKVAAALDGKSPSDTHFRRIRNKPLLMLHVIGPEGLEHMDNRVPAFGISFPFGHYDTEIEVVVNQVWIELMESPHSDSPDDEEDFDD